MKSMILRQEFQSVRNSVSDSTRKKFVHGNPIWIPKTKLRNASYQVWWARTEWPNAPRFAASVTSTNGT